MIFFGLTLTSAFVTLILGAVVSVLIQTLITEAIPSEIEKQREAEMASQIESFLAQISDLSASLAHTLEEIAELHRAGPIDPERARIRIEVLEDEIRSLKARAENIFDVYHGVTSIQIKECSIDMMDALTRLETELNEAERVARSNAKLEEEHKEEWEDRTLFQVDAGLEIDSDYDLKEALTTLVELCDEFGRPEKISPATFSALLSRLRKIERRRNVKN